MAEKLEDLNLPISVVARLVKEGLPDGVIVSKEAKTAVARAASVFVLYITSTANTIAMRNKRKTINSDDVFQAVIDTEYQWLQEPLKESFEGISAFLFKQITVHMDCRLGLDIILGYVVDII
ncbi:Sequence-specific DNA binding [Homalodisca vitripennis]|nr:Sequence-specific DNA binding [Homalodisca vitripennis]